MDPLNLTATTNAKTLIDEYVAAVLAKGADLETLRGAIEPDLHHLEQSPAKALGSMVTLLSEEYVTLAGHDAPVPRDHERGPSENLQLILETAEWFFVATMISVFILRHRDDISGVMARLSSIGIRIDNNITVGLELRDAASRAENALKGGDPSANSAPESVRTDPISRGSDEKGSPLDRLRAELARVIHDGDEAALLATDSGFLPARLPKFTTSTGFWTRVLEEIGNGAPPGKLDPLVRAAAKRYPHNEIFTLFCNEDRSQR